jgi:hypothetical protein
MHCPTGTSEVNVVRTPPNQRAQPLAVSRQRRYARLPPLTGKSANWYVESVD